MKLLKLVILFILIFLMALIYAFNASKVISFKGVTVHVPFVSKKVNSNTSILVLRYPLNGTSLFIAATKMSNEEFVGKYKSNIADKDHFINYSEIAISGHRALIIRSRANAPSLYRTHIFISDLKLIFRIEGNRSDENELMEAIIRLHADM